MEHSLKNILIPGVSNYPRAGVGQKENSTFFSLLTFEKQDCMTTTYRDPSDLQDSNQIGTHGLKCTLSETVNDKKNNNILNTQQVLGF